MISRLLTRFVKISKATDTIPNRVASLVLMTLISAQMAGNLKISVTILALCFHFFTRLHNATEADAS